MKPFVSVIIPCRNEAAFLARSLDSVLNNDYPRDRMEVIIADGMSSDGTRERIQAYCSRDSRVRLVDNAARITPAALNRAIEASRGEIILRVDAHSAISADYISKAAAHLESTGAWNVGGVMHTIAEGIGPFAEPIRLALTHRFGVGNSVFRTGSDVPRWVDTVFGGCWPREVFHRVGGFNENLVRSQDMEFNVRLRRAGGRILLAPDLESRYWARANLAYFVRHNWANGVWAVLPFAYSEGAPVRIRHLVPLAFVVSLALSILAGSISAQLFALPLLVAGSYLAVNLAVACQLGLKTRSIGAALLLPIAFASLHWVYGAGSLWGVARLVWVLLKRRLVRPRRTLFARRSQGGFRSMKVAAVREKQTEEWYEHYYTTKGDDRSDALRNPGVLFQNLAFEKSIVEALRRLPGDKRLWKILDVGCGAGFSMLRLLSHGLEPERLYGIDIEQSRIDRGLRRFPTLNLLHGDASDMDFQSDSFDLAMESTMFIQLTDEPMARAIANEMLRVVKPGGFLMLTDWRYSFGRPGYRALPSNRIANLFAVGTRSRVVCRTHGALIPVLGRALSQYASWLYFPVCKLCPPMVGQLTVILQKNAS